MPDDLFKQPAPPSGGVNWSSLQGSLLLFYVRGVETGIVTRFSKPGESTDAVRVDLDVLDGKGAGEHHHDVLVFPKMLRGQLRDSVGGRVIGRLTLGVATNGNSAPWLLDQASESDVAKARAFLTGTGSSAAASSGVQPPF